MDLIYLMVVKRDFRLQANKFSARLFDRGHTNASKKTNFK